MCRCLYREYFGPLLHAWVLYVRRLIISCVVAAQGWRLGGPSRADAGRPAVRLHDPAQVCREYLLLFAKQAFVSVADLKALSASAEGQGLQALQLCPWCASTITSRPSLQLADCAPNPPLGRLGEHFRCHWTVPPSAIDPSTKEPVILTHLHRPNEDDPAISGFNTPNETGSRTPLDATESDTRSVKSGKSVSSTKAGVTTGLVAGGVNAGPPVKVAFLVRSSATSQLPPVSVSC